MTLKVRYDADIDVLYLAKPGLEQEVREIYPGLNL